MQPILKCEQVRRSFGSAPVLNDVSIEIRGGTITLLKGRNGSGKTTLINCLTGFDHGFEGAVLLNEASLKGKSADECARLGVVRTFQYPHLFSSFTVRDHLALGRNSNYPSLRSYIRLRWRKAFIEDVTHGLDLAPVLNRRGGELSFGEMKLVNIVRAFMTGARVLLLDEPLASLHGRRREAVIQAVCEKRLGGAAILVIEHEAPELLKLADFVYELREGKLFFEG